MNVAGALVPRPLLSYKQALAWLYGLQRFGIKLGLDNIRRLLDELSRSGGFQAAVGDLDIALSWKVIHVAGTNGKGSVCAMIDSICRAQGYCTGLFISPHLITFRERIRVNGEMISEDAVADGLNFTQVADRLGKSKGQIMGRAYRLGLKSGQPATWASTLSSQHGATK